MNKVKNILMLCIILCFICLPCKAQTEKVIEPPAEVIKAFYSNDTTRMLEYIKSGEYPMRYKPDGIISPFEAALRENRLNVAMFLIRNAGFRITDEDISTLLSLEDLNIDEYNSLLSLASGKNKIDITKCKEKYLNELRYDYPKGAFFNGYEYFKLKLLIMYGFDLINLLGPEGRTMFYISVIEYEDLELMEHLNYEDEAFNGYTCHGPTVLTSAAYTRNYDIVKYLVDKGLDKTVRTFEACYDDAQEGPSAYEIAEGFGDEKMMELLK